MIGEGPNVDFSPPAGGFPLGDYTLTLKVADSLGNEDSATRTFTIVEDADNDGLTAAEEALPCVTQIRSTRATDLDPMNAFRDDDNADGIPNVDDPAICTAAAIYEAIVDIDADMVKNQPLGVITGFVTLRYRPITAVNGSDRQDLEHQRDHGEHPGAAVERRQERRRDRQVRQERRHRVHERPQHRYGLCVDHDQRTVRRKHLDVRGQRPDERALMKGER